MLIGDETLTGASEYTFNIEFSFSTVYVTRHGIV